MWHGSVKRNLISRFSPWTQLNKMVLITFLIEQWGPPLNGQRDAVEVAHLSIDILNSWPTKPMERQGFIDRSLRSWIQAHPMNSSILWITTLWWKPVEPKCLQIILTLCFSHSWCYQEVQSRYFVTCSSLSMHNHMVVILDEIRSSINFSTYFQVWERTKLGFPNNNSLSNDCFKQLVTNILKLFMNLKLWMFLNLLSQPENRLILFWHNSISEYYDL